MPKLFHTSESQHLYNKNSHWWPCPIHRYSCLPLGPKNNRFFSCHFAMLTDLDWQESLAAFVGSIWPRSVHGGSRRNVKDFAFIACQHAQCNIIMTNQSVCPSHSGIVSEQMHLSSLFPPSGRGMTLAFWNTTTTTKYMRVGKFWNFWLKSPFYLRNSTAHTTGEGLVPRPLIVAHVFLILIDSPKCCYWDLKTEVLDLRSDTNITTTTTTTQRCSTCTCTWTYSICRHVDISANF